MAPTDPIVDTLKQTVDKLQQRIEELEARLSGGSPSSSTDGMRMILIGPPGAGTKHRDI